MKICAAISRGTVANQLDGSQAAIIRKASCPRQDQRPGLAPRCVDRLGEFSYSRLGQCLVQDYATCSGLLHRPLSRGERELKPRPLIAEEAP